MLWVVVIVCMFVVGFFCGLFIVFLFVGGDFGSVVGGVF